MASSILELVIVLLWTCLSSTPSRQKYPLYSKFFPTRVALESFFSSVSLVFAPGLLEVLQASTPPTIAYFKGLPTECKSIWAIYLLVLEKQGYRPKIYIGSGTAAKHGVSSRLGQYTRGQVLPIRVEKALNDGYAIEHKGILCSTPVPSAALVPLRRLIFIIMEATFTFYFWALASTTEYGYSMADFCPWARDTLEYDGLCSHNPLYEAPAGDFSLSAEELEAIAAEVADRRASYMVDYRENVKNEDPESYYAAAREQRAKWVKNNPEKAAANDRRTIAKAVKEKRHYCAICDHAFTKGAKLKTHLAGPKHAAKAALVLQATSVA